MSLDEDYLSLTDDERHSSSSTSLDLLPVVKRKYIVFVPVKKFEKIASAFREAFRLNVLRETVNQRPPNRSSSLSKVTQLPPIRRYSGDEQKVCTLQKQYLAALNASLDRRVFVIERECHVKITLDELNPIMVRGQVGHELCIQGETERNVKSAWLRLCDLIPELTRFALVKRDSGASAGRSKNLKRRVKKSRERRLNGEVDESVNRLKNAKSCLDVPDLIPNQTCSHAAVGQKNPLCKMMNSPEFAEFGAIETYLENSKLKTSVSQWTQTESQVDSQISSKVSTNEEEKGVTHFWNCIGQMVGRSVVEAIMASQNKMVPSDDTVSKNSTLHQMEESLCKTVPKQTEYLKEENRKATLDSSQANEVVESPPSMTNDTLAGSIDYPQHVCMSETPKESDISFCSPINSSRKKRISVLPLQDVNRRRRHGASSSLYLNRSNSPERAVRAACETRSMRASHSRHSSRDTSSILNSHAMPVLSTATKQRQKEKNKVKVQIKTVGRLRYRLITNEQRAIVVMPFNIKTRPLFRHDIFGRPKSRQLLQFCCENGLRISTLKLIEPSINEISIKKPTLAMDCKVQEPLHFEEAMSRLDDLIEKEIYYKDA